MPSFFSTRAASAGALAFGLASAAALLAVPAPAPAQLSDQERARVHFQTATSYYDQGRYQEAAAQFRESHQLSGRHHILLNVSRCHELAGEFGAAAAALEEYLAAVPDAPDRRTIAQRAESLRVRAGPTPSSAEDDGAAPEPELVGPVVLLAAGGALGLGAVGTGVATLEVESSLQDDCGADRVCPSDRRGDADTGRALALGTDLLLGAALAVAGAGAVWLLLEVTKGAPEEEPGVAPSAACGPSGCVVGARGSF